MSSRQSQLWVQKSYLEPNRISWIQLACQFQTASDWILIIGLVERIQDWFIMSTLGLGVGRGSSMNFKNSCHPMSQCQLSIAQFPQLSVEFSIVGNSKTISFCFSYNTHYIPLLYPRFCFPCLNLNSPRQETPFYLLWHFSQISAVIYLFTYSLIQQQVLNAYSVVELARLWDRVINKTQPMP